MIIEHFISGLHFDKVWFTSLFGFLLKIIFHTGKLKFSTRPCKTLNPKFSFLLRNQSLFEFDSVINKLSFLN